MIENYYALQINRRCDTYQIQDQNKKDVSSKELLRAATVKHVRDEQIDMDMQTIQQDNTEETKQSKIMCRKVILLQMARVGSNRLNTVLRGLYIWPILRQFSWQKSSKTREGGLPPP